MKFDTGHALHNGGYSRQGPQLGTETMMPGPLAKSLLDPANLSLSQTGFPASPSGPLEGLDPTLFPLLIPPAHTLSTGLYLSGHGGQDRFTTSKEAGSQPPSPRKFIEIAAWSADHHDQIIRLFSGIVTIKRGYLSLYYARLNSCRYRGPNANSVLVAWIMRRPSARRLVGARPDHRRCAGTSGPVRNVCLPAGGGRREMARADLR
jgi:hypothetical protein